MNNTEIFIEKYNQLELVVKTTYQLSDSDSISYYLTEQKRFVSFKPQIKYCQSVRNLLHHNQKIQGKYSVIPSDEMLYFINELIDQISNRSKCYAIAIKTSQIYQCRLDDSIRKAMLEMKKFHYTHVPILDNEKVIGVFDENVLFNFLIEDEIVEIDINTKFRDIKNYLNFENREMVDFLFFKSTAYVDELIEEFEKSFRRGKRVGLVFLTSTGSKNERITGIITAWDILANIQK